MKTEVVLTLGESLLRLSTPYGQRLSQTSELQLAYGGAEANVASNLAQLGHITRYASKVPQHALGDAVIQQLKAQGVDTTFVLRGGTRLGTYYFEKGASLRGGAVIYDRKQSSFAEMVTLEWDLDDLFAGVSLFHISGITLALSPFWQQAGVVLMQEARKRGITISFDMNYRAKLWDYTTARAVYRAVLPLVDYLSASARDAIHFMGIKDKGEDTAYYIRKIAALYPQLQVVYGTKREVLAANHYKIKGYVYNVCHDLFAMSSEYTLTEIVDRIGAGDAYAAAVLSGLLRKENVETVAQFATAATVLKHTIVGDRNQFTQSEIEQFINNAEHMQR